jgi:hypothetical protein
MIADRPPSLSWLLAWLEAEQFYCAQKLSADGTRIVGLNPMIFTWAIFTDLDEFGYGDRFCYQDTESAWKAFQSWSGDQGTEPEGWIRHPSTGRRRPNGDATKEYVLP